MKTKTNTTKTSSKLGSASITISINDRDGFTVTQAGGEAILAAKPYEQTTNKDWDTLWNAINAITKKKLN